MERQIDGLNKKLDDKMPSFLLWSFGKGRNKKWLSVQICMQGLASWGEDDYEKDVQNYREEYANDLKAAVMTVTDRHTMFEWSEIEQRLQGHPAQHEFAS